MILTAFHGFCMALADSVPGVSGGTIAFILGFYERFIHSLHNVFGKDRQARRDALLYLLKLGIGWVIGMAACVFLLSNLFAQNIYFMSSLFLGLTAASIPFILSAERQTLRRGWKGFPFALLGLALVVGLTLLRTGAGTLGAVDYSRVDPVQFAYLFLSGAVAVTAMVLPGISGSSILLIAGVYLPTIQAIRSVLGLHVSVMPGLLALSFGILAGIWLSIRAIHAALQKYRGQMVWLILGLMFGSLYAIGNGPASLDVSLPPLSLGTFQLSAFVLGAALLFGLEFLRKVLSRRPSAAENTGKEPISHEP